MSGAQSEIPGRTPLSLAQLALIKSLDQQHVRQMDALEVLMRNPDIDQRALALAVTNAQQAHMWAVRAVAKPVF